MSFKDKLPKLSRPIVASAAIMGGAFLGGEAKADTTPAPEPVPATQAGWTWDRDDKLNGFELAPTNGLKVVTGKVSDALDPEKKYRDNEFLNGDVHTVSLGGRISSEETHIIRSEEKGGDFEYEDSFERRLAKGDARVMLEKPDKAISSLTTSMVGSYISGKKGQGFPERITDKIDGAEFLMENQTDRLNLQQWLQDSINGVIAQKGDMTDKLETLKALGGMFEGTLAPELDALPNPDNVQARSGGEKQFDAMYQQKLADVAAGKSVQLRIGGLKSTKTGQTLAPEQLKALAGHSK